jgi:hypothetical protein
MRTLPAFLKFLPGAVCILLSLSWASPADEASWFVRDWVFDYAYYDNSGQCIGLANARVKQVHERNDTIFSESSVVFTDESGKVTGLGAFYYAKDSFSFISEAKNFLPPKIKYDNVEDVRITGNPLNYPLRLDTGMSLKGTTATMKFVRSNASSIMLYELANRKVTGKDSVETKAGKFACWVITYDEHIKPVTGAKKQRDPRTRTVTEWYNPQYGVVKAEYRRDGDVEMVRMLTGVKH